MQTATATERQLNTGLLMVRIGIAASQLVYALPRLFDGAPAWRSVGSEIRFLHIGFSTQILGIVLLSLEILASLGLLTGYLFRISATLLTAVYGLYFFNFINVGYKTLPLYAGALAVVCAGMLAAGPGRFAVAVKIESK